MKQKILAVFALLLLFCVCGTFGVCAEGENTVYVADGGTGDGSTPLSPVGTLSAAYDAVGDGGRIVVCGRLTQAVSFTEPSHQGKILLTSKDDTTDYRTSGARLLLPNSVRYNLSGETTFEYLDMQGSSTQSDGCVNFVFCGRFHPITFGDGILFRLTDGTAVTSYDGTKMKVYLLGGAQSDHEEAGQGTNRDASVTIRSGIFHVVSGFSRQIGKAYTGTASISVSGGTVYQVYFGNVTGKTGASSYCSDLYMTGGSIDTCFFSAKAYPNANCHLYLDGGTITKFSSVTIPTGEMTVLSTGKGTTPTLSEFPFTSVGTTDAMFYLQGERREPYTLEGDGEPLTTDGCHEFGGGVIFAGTPTASVLTWSDASGSDVYFLKNGLYEKQSALTDLLGVCGFSVRTSGAQGLRFKADIATAASMGRIGDCTVLRFGVIAKCGATSAPLLLHGDGCVESMAYDRAQGVEYCLDYDAERSRFAAVLVGIGTTEYRTRYDARAYCLLDDGEGVRIVYGQTCGACISEIAAKALEDTSLYSPTELLYLRDVVSCTDSYRLTLIDSLNQNVVPLSHENESASAALLERDFRTYTKLNSEITTYTRYDVGSYYPRIKKMANGKYIMFFQYGLYGQHIYYAIGNSLTDWGAPQVLAKSSKFSCDYTVDGVHYSEDAIYWMTCDATVLRDGTLIAVSSFRPNHGYRIRQDLSGISVFVSKDNGVTWSQPKQIYTGIGWEPSILQLENGTIQVFFTHSAPMIALYGFNENRRSTGVGMLQSTDGGKTWMPSVTSSPYEATRVMQHYIGIVDGQKHYTDQMPVGTQFPNGKTLLVAEYYAANKSYSITLGLSLANGAWKTLGINEEGPTGSRKAVFSGAGPYVISFASGESVVTYNRSGLEYYRMVTSALSCGSERRMFTDTYNSCWGSCTKDSEHGVVMIAPDIDSTNKKNSVILQLLRLNHALYAKALNASVDASSEEWYRSTDALFVGSDSQAQMSVRVGYNDDSIFAFCDVSDASVCASDKVQLRFYDGVGTRTVTVSADGIVTTTADGVRAAARQVSGGYCVEIALPRRSDQLRVFPLLGNVDNGVSCSDVIDGMTAGDTNTWMTVYFD